MVTRIPRRLSACAFTGSASFAFNWRRIAKARPNPGNLRKENNDQHSGADPFLVQKNEGRVGDDLTLSESSS